MFLTSGGGAAAAGAFKLWLLCSFITTEYNDREEEERCKKLGGLNCLWDCGLVVSTHAQTSPALSSCQ